MKLKQINRELEEKLACATAKSAQVSQSIPLSTLLDFKGQTHRLCTACSEIPNMQKHSSLIFCKAYSHAFICFLFSEIGVVTIASSAKGPCSLCARVLLSQNALSLWFCPTGSRVFIGFICITPFEFLNLIIVYVFAKVLFAFYFQINSFL